MGTSRHLGVIGGLGVGATVIYYQSITTACAAEGVVPRMTIAHANAPTALAHVQAGRLEGLADYLASFAAELAAAGAAFAAIPAITPHICRSQLKQRSALPLLDALEATAGRLRERRLRRVALFGTKFTIDSQLFGALEEFAIVRPRDEVVEEIHRIYLELATKGQCAASDEARLREIADGLCRREGVESVVLAGTDLNLIFDEDNAGFPAVDCAAAHVAAIVAAMLASA
jgi:aspartate racemase